jgi:hypothetical protein
MFAVILADAGLLVGLLGLAALIKPLPFLRIVNRKRAAVVFAAGLLTTTTALLLPAPEMTVQTPQTALDRVAPSYEFHEVHSIRIRATPDRVYKAIKQVTADEILFFRTLIWIRRFGRSGPESVLNVPEHRSLLDVATQTTFVTLADGPDEIVVSTIVVAPSDVTIKRPLTLEQFNAIHGPGFALASMNFLIKDAGQGACDVSTETRVHATDASARRRFAAYWRVIYPGSALIRRMWLRAIKRRAEAS